MLVCPTRRTRRLIARGVVLCAPLLFGCAEGTSGLEQAEIDVVPQVLPLVLDADLADVEFSSLCWWGDDLLLLPQFPALDGRGLLVISRDSIARAIAELEAGAEVRPLKPRRVQVESNALPDSIKSYDGLEAIVMLGERCIVLAEFGDSEQGWGSRLVAGSIQRKEGRMFLEHIAEQEIRGPSIRNNFTNEALLLSEEEVWVISELNGSRIVDQPVLARFSLDLEPLGFLPMPSLEYRITDATALDAHGRFWVLNLFWPADAETVQPGSSPGPIEQLVPLRHVNDRVELDLSRPVLDLRGDREHPMHNWEGLARFGEDGFLIVTDKYPGNILAYVARPDK